MQRTLPAIMFGLRMACVAVSLGVPLSMLPLLCDLRRKHIPGIVKIRGLFAKTWLPGYNSVSFWLAGFAGYDNRVRKVARERKV